MNEEETSPLTARLLDGEETGFEPIPSSGKNDVITSADVIESQPDPTTTTTIAATDQSWERGEKQPPAFRDWQYGLIFHIQFIAIITLGSIYTNSFLQTQSQFGNGSDDGSGETQLDLMTIILPSLISALTAVMFVFLSFAIMARMGKTFIACSVWTSAVISFMVGITALSLGIVPLGILSLFSSAIGCCYAFAVRNRIPFAAANLNAALSSIKANAGVTLIVILLGGCMFGWMILWTISLFGVIDVQVVCDDENNGLDNNQCSVEVQQGGWILPWVFFLFWTQQVFKNLIHTTVAGLVGTWYFDPQEAKSFCSKALSMSLLRSLTYSFGSICLGSLLVAILQFLNWIVVSLRSEQNRNGNANIGVSLLLCCLDCILRLLQGIIEYFNKWAFVYVGVYGYPFVTAGKKVMTLFEQRGWTVIINDNLISRALGLMCFIIALISGIAPLIFLTSEDSVSNPGAFAIGFIIALLLAMTVMNIVDSAVSTIIVCFAEAPDELERNHSTHSRDMKEAWNKVYEIRF